MRKSILWLIAVVAAAALAACAPVRPDPVEPTSFEVQLAGDNEVPAVATTATGTVEATLDGNTLTLSGSFEGLESDLLPIAGSPAHVHLGAAGENGPVVFIIDVESTDQRSGTLSLQVELDTEQRQQFLNNRFYVNIHTEGNPAGELRAQLDPGAPTFAAIDASFSATLSAGAVVPPVAVETDASGKARAILRGNTLVASGTFMGLSSPLRDYPVEGLPPTITEAIHIHKGAIGEAGPFVRQFTPVLGEDERSGHFGLKTELSAEERSELMAGFYYVDVHTVANPAGELRGQLLPDGADATSFKVELAGDNEVPAVATTATGSVRVGLVDDMLILSGSFEGLESNLLPIAGSPAHLHLGAAGENGPVVFAIDVESTDQRSGTLSLQVELDTEQRQQFLNNRFYVNIHTEGNPAGELRAQLDPGAPTFAAIDASFTAMLSADNEVPPVAVESDATGMARAIVRGDDVVVSGTFEGLVSDLFDIGEFGPAHVHMGAVGETGGVVLVLEVVSEDRRSGRFGASASVDADVRSALLDGMLYVNIHTEANQPGEIRGQLFPDLAPLTVSATLSGEAEVPPVETSATGTVEATLDGFTFTLSGSFEGLESNLLELAGSPAHIHDAPAGENGPVVFLIEVDSSDERSGTLSLETPLNDFELAAFLAGRFYVNIHTEGNPGGELRAQLEPEVTLGSVMAPARQPQTQSSHHGHHH